MNIDYISDLHLDFYVEPEGSQENYTAKTRAFLQQLLPETLAEVLVITGDLSHFNQQSFDTLQFFSEQHVYEKAGISFAINALGYPKEGLVKAIRTIAIVKSA